ncbi:helix-turn-helix transcriptional regulator [Chitinophaga nivalis]|uniref:AraC family transcriptional regulator n=1 Tax=Chitinophaga nivalis TaxID=2991709 RepID=A0ABT3IHV8_9BACT|nr:AraC family transcriptional regulator [Chitinophaga nivalis]MCW3466767.1 AraC family transcriptional regulator [Chitinophaga nivalis]MCW3483542.1 AraC family transcriptional regulator [Chitinophaga nivalis]
MRALEGGTYLGTTARSFQAGGIIISQTHYREKVYEGWHCHEHHHVSLLLKGGNTEHRKGTSTVVGAGDVIYYRSGEVHRNVDTSHPSGNLNLEITSAFLEKYDLHFDTLEKFPAQVHRLKFALLQIYRACSEGYTNPELAIQDYLLPVFSTPVVRHTTEPAWVIRLRELMHDRWNETLLLDEMSVITGVHPVTISRYFPHYFHCSLSEYQRRIKIAQALILVRETPLSLTAIAHHCGFFDQSHFIRTFKACTGWLPRQFREL